MWYALDKNNKPYPIDLFKLTPKQKAELESRKSVYQEYLFNIDKWEPCREYLSTIFLGLDHGFNSENPVLWESMSFPRSIEDEEEGGWSEKHFDRYESYEEAVEGHKRIRKLIQQELIKQSWKAIIPATIFLTATIILSQWKG